MMPAVVTMATVAEPWASRSAALMRYAETITGSPIAVIEPARALPTPVACSTAPKNAPAPTTSRIMPIGLSDSPVIRRQLADGHAAPDTQQVHGEQHGDGERDRRGPEEDHDRTGRFDPGARTTLPNVALRMSSIGTAMTVAISASRRGPGSRTAVAVPPRAGPGPRDRPGRLESPRDASSSAAMNSSGTSTRIRLPMKDPHQTPADQQRGDPADQAHEDEPAQAHAQQPGGRDRTRVRRQERVCHRQAGEHRQRVEHQRPPAAASPRRRPAAPARRCRCRRTPGCRRSGR